jgi:hypothetical protein
MFNRMSGGETDAEDSGHVWQHLSQPCETEVRNGRNSSLLSCGLTANCLCVFFTQRATLQVGTWIPRTSRAARAASTLFLREVIKVVAHPRGGLKSLLFEAFHLDSPCLYIHLSYHRTCTLTQSHIFLFAIHTSWLGLWNVFSSTGWNICRSSSLPFYWHSKKG